MAKRLEKVGNSLSDLVPRNGTTSDNRLSITFDHLPDTMPEKHQEAMRDIVLSILGAAGINGRWRFSDIRREKYRQHSSIPTFQAKSVINERRLGSAGIKILVRAGTDRDGCYSGIIIPPSNLDAGTVLKQLVNQKDTSEPAEQVKEAEAGESYLGRVSGMKEYGVFVDIFPHNPMGRKAALCHITEISHKFNKKPNDELRMRQLVMVKCIGFNSENKPQMSRKAILPIQDSFDPKPKGGELSMNGFTESIERVAIALTYIKYSIDRHANKAAWDRAGERGIIGGVFMEGKDYAFAPACYVQCDLKKGLQNEWGAKRVTTISGLMRYLISMDYIWPSTDSAGQLVGYCMMPKGLWLIKLDPVPLPEYYEPPTTKKGTGSVECDEVVPVATSVDAPTTPVPVEEVQIVKEPVKIDTSSSLVTLLDQYDLFRQKKTRRDQVAALLAEYDALVAESLELDAWLEENKDILAQVAAIKQLSERIAAVQI